MDYETQDTQVKAEGKQKDHVLAASILLSSIILAGAWAYHSELTLGKEKSLDTPSDREVHLSALEEAVLPPQGIELPVTWGDAGAKMVSLGVIDAKKFAALYEERGAFTDEYKNLLLNTNNGKLTITKDNAGYLLNLFWALGLSSKNDILERGEMTNPAYGGAGNFASTAGWTIALGDPMDHYSKHRYFNLTKEQQALVDKISSGIYRPCCGNSTHFPDCNHGMAMLGLLELMASQGASEEEMWKAALAVNSYWFPDTYMTLAAYMQSQGTAWQIINPRQILGRDYSSASGFQKIAARMSATESKDGGGCGVDAGISRGRAQSGCGI